MPPAGARPAGRAAPTRDEEWRTPPLWGLRDSAPYLHDGRAATLEEAIELHGGEASDLAARFQGLSPDQEPTPAQIQQILNVINQTGSKYIFYEELVSPGVAQALAQEAHVQTMVLSPIEGLNGTESQNGDTYLTLMEMNLANLRTALECT